MRSLLIAVAQLSARSAMWHWLNRLGGPGLLLLGLVDNSAIPVPGSQDVLTILLSARNPDLWPYYAFMATVGAIIGGYITYRLAEKGGEATLEKKIGQKKATIVYSKLEKQGGFWVFLGAVMPPPFPIVPVLMAAGILEYPRKKFLTVLALGRGLRYFAIAWVAHVYGVVIIHWLTHYERPLLYILIGLAVAGGLGALAYFKWFRAGSNRRMTAAPGTENRSNRHSPQQVR